MSDVHVQTVEPQALKPEDAITLTDAAIAHIETWIAKQGGGVGIAFGVKPAGCTGWKYVVDFAETAPVDAHEFKATDSVSVFVDDKSMPFVKGTRIDYVKEILKQGFVYHNPNEKDACGCGESFGV